MMKKLIVSGVAVLIVLVCAVRFELVAQESERDGPVANRAAIEHARAMVEAVEKAHEAVNEEYSVNQVQMESVYVWSRRWLDAELVLSGLEWRDNAERLNAERSEAFAAHLKRMEWLHAKVADLYHAGASGGEASNYHGTQFFVAEAKLWAEGEGAANH